MKCGYQFVAINSRLSCKTRSQSVFLLKRKNPAKAGFLKWLREQDLNLRPSGYEPDELPDCSIPRLYFYLLDLLLSIRQLSRYIVHFLWLREQDLNLRPSGYEPDELPDCSIPRQKIRCWCQRFLLPPFNVVRIIHRDFTNTRATRGNISFF